ncbi:MAG TPA: tail fiber domain-containing protein [Thermoanaerobaculia bacterium]
MTTRHILPVLILLGVFGVVVAGGQELAQVDERHSHQAPMGEIPNWAAPATWSPARPNEGLTTMGAVTSPLPFIGVDPCRIADTRQAGFPAGYGPPALTAGVPRNFTLTGKCGIPPLTASLPPLAAAVSLNVTVTNTQGPGFILIYPQGAAQPDVSTLNYVAGQTIANAAIVSLGTAGGITVIAGVSGTDVILDVNGYYAPAGVGTNNTFLGLNAGNFTMTGTNNTGIGHNALFSNTTGDNNTANGVFALAANTMGSNNTAVGVVALWDNTTGMNNTAIGVSALVSNTAGNYSTAIGSAALVRNTMGDSNTATGGLALFNNITGSFNTAVGRSALENSMGNGDIGLGDHAGFNITTGNNNICIGNGGVADESNTIRVGTAGTHTATFVAGINGTGVTGVPVLVSSSGQLGVASSSRYVKEDIRTIAEESDGLMRLRPVAFKYKPQIDSTGLAQYGLIAEEVADVYPDLVTYYRDGRPETVRYHLVNALLLNEVQKQHRTAEAQEITIDQQKAEIEELKARLSSLEARLPAELRP